MKKIVALILSFLYFGYVAAVLLNTYSSGHDISCAASSNNSSSYSINPPENSNGCSHIEVYNIKFQHEYPHIASHGKVSVPHVQVGAAQPAYFSSLPGFIVKRLQLSSPVLFIYTVPVFLKNCVFRL